MTMTTITGSAAATGGAVLATTGPDRRVAGGTTRTLTKTRTVGIIGIEGIVATDGMTAATVVHTLTAGTLGVIDGTTTAAAGRT